MMTNSYNPDVLSCLANLSSDEVFTPPSLANEMLDLLPAELWSNKGAKFLDPVCKSGVFLREIAKRLLKGLEKEIPDLQKRIDHIFHNQIYGIAITELTGLLARRSVYCSKKADGEYSITEFASEHGNILFEQTEHKWKNDKCEFCGASKEQYDRNKDLETHAYRFIHTDNAEEIFDMKFDVIIGNPPYQLDTGGSGRQAKPIYQLFVQQAKALNPRFLTMIIPSRWFAGGMGLNDFRAEMLNDQQIRKIVDYVDARDVFPSVDIAGGACYFLWQKGTKGPSEVISCRGGKTSSSTRFLNEFPTFVRFAEAVSILRKVRDIKEDNLTGIISAVRPFGLATSDRPDKTGELRLISSGGEGPLQKDRVTVGHNMINKWKVITSKTSHDHAGQPDKEGMRRILSRVEIIEPKCVVTESYIVLGAFDSKKEAENLYEYVTTQFVRFLASLLSFSQDITRERFAYVPMQSFAESWSDEKLYEKYGIDSDEIAFIDSLIRPFERTLF